MLDIKFVRNNPDVVKQNIKNKFQDEKLPLVDEVIELDKRNREIKQEVEALRAEKNKASKEIGAMMAQKKIEEAEGFADLQAELPAVADAFKQVNEGKMEVAGFVDVLKTLAEETTDEEVKAAIEELVEKLDGKDFVTGFDEFKVLDADKAEKNADGKYEVEIAVPSITDTMENIQLVAYSKEDAKKWQIVDPISVDKENKTLEVALDDGAFFTVVADAE